MDGREHHGFILLTSLLPLAGVIAAAVLLWNDIFGASDLAVFLLMYAVAGLGVSTGYHRLLAHRAFKTYRPLRVMFTVFGAMAGQGPPIIWTAHHRRHHRLADKPGDPHSPYHDEQPGVRGALSGLWHAHLGWLLDRDLSSDPLRYCPDLARDRDMRVISRHFPAIVLAGLLIPGLLGYALAGTWQAALTGVLWGGLVRFFVTNHVTYAVNSIGHYFGSRRFPTPDESRNVGWLALFSFGEAWHNNHHAFPRSASHGMRWYEIDISAVVIGALARVGLAWDVVKIDRGLQDQRAAHRGRGGRAAPASPDRPLAERIRGAVAQPSDVE